MTLIAASRKAIMPDTMGTVCTSGGLLGGRQRAGPSDGHQGGATQPYSVRTHPPILREWSCFSEIYIGEAREVDLDHKFGWMEG